MNKLNLIKVIFKILAKIVATDETYKLNYHGLPILMFGTIDLARQYHPYGIMITKNLFKGEDN